MSGADSAYDHVVLTPLIVAGNMIGVVILARTWNLPFTTDEVAAVQHFGTLGALLVENEKLRARFEEPPTNSSMTPPLN